MFFAKKRLIIDKNLAILFTPTLVALLLLLLYKTLALLLPASSLARPSPFRQNSRLLVRILHLRLLLSVSPPTNPATGNTWSSVHACTACFFLHNRAHMSDISFLLRPSRSPLLLRLLESSAASFRGGT